MIVAISTGDWRSGEPATLQRMWLPETLVMSLTVFFVVVTGNLAIGTFVGAVRRPVGG